ncbi:mannitol dehydrogenase family protein (plasmid) [Bartonella sp. HY329]|uniref:mannitol dehydrogenase family protein n=1 Tax=unclassified Bartonella TaxID=2645622 RepID=UPI0021C8D3DC|nr:MULTISPECIES: mannitol dehydrogenase family protein [unclassified Bartonella]UXM96606.1 mannitol dehydrogenase family protein [Bartonella sp. HY329]UXN10929.1 mannitol dehydrogenase family protein [Bartonella sp. HY328]
MTALSLDNLDEISKNVAKPNYKRSALKAGIVHFGIGNFHRAHQAVYLDELFNQGLDHDWAIIGAGVTPYDEAMRAKLCEQDYLTTIIEQDSHKSAAHITGAMIDFLDPQNHDNIIEALTNPDIRIVSMTITEGGYFINEATDSFDTNHPAIIADGRNPDHPKTVFGILIAGLKRRRAKGIAPFTIVSCDNIPGNGHVAQNTVIGLAQLFDQELALWIKQDVAFPNSMVDRITPATSAREIEYCRDTYGINDKSPVFCEEFRQWVIEDNFTLGRPQLEAVGVTFVDDVAPYELMKIRILNGGHAAIAYAGELLDIHYVHEAMEEPLIAGYLRKLEQSEIIPCVPPVPNINLQDYLALIERRFSNPKIGDTISRLAQDGSNRQPKFILPSIADRLKDDQDVKGLALASALWCRYFEGTTDSGRKIIFNDDKADQLHQAAVKAKNDPSVFLAMDDIYGRLAESALFQRRFSEALNSLYENGTRATLNNYINS